MKNGAFVVHPVLLHNHSHNFGHWHFGSSGDFSPLWVHSVPGAIHRVLPHAVHSYVGVYRVASNCVFPQNATAEQSATQC